MASYDLWKLSGPDALSGFATKEKTMKPGGDEAHIDSDCNTELLKTKWVRRLRDSMDWETKPQLLLGIHVAEAEQKGAERMLWIKWFSRVFIFCNKIIN